jgi:hypothetical protein
LNPATGLTVTDRLWDVEDLVGRASAAGQKDRRHERLVSHVLERVCSYRRRAALQTHHSLPGTERRPHGTRVPQEDYSRRG